MSIVEFYQREELVGLVVELTERYSGFDSTSVTYERAQQLMEAVCYCLQMHQHWRAICRLVQTLQCGRHINEVMRQSAIRHGR